MENIDNISYESLCRYFKHLSLFGYMKDVLVNKLILLLFLRKFLQDYLLLEKDYKKIICIINCLLDSSCMIPYDINLNYDTYVLNNTNNDSTQIRISEDDIIRVSLNSAIRIADL